MRTVLLALLVVGMALANSVTSVSETYTGAPGPSYTTDTELSIDNGTPGTGWVYTTGSGAYVAVDYTTPATKATWYLEGIKYCVNTTWPDATFQGFGVCAWGMSGGVPGSISWPASGVPQYHNNADGTPGVPGAGYKWCQVDIPAAQQWTLPAGFLVGITFLYNYPASDAFGVDNTGASAHDWAMTSAGWTVAPYGKGMARALITDDNPGIGVETSTMGAIRAMYR